MAGKLFDEETESALRDIFRGFKGKVVDRLVVETGNPRPVLEGEVEEAPIEVEEEIEEHGHAHTHIHRHGECPTCEEAVELARELMRVSEGKLEFLIVQRAEAEALRPRFVPAFYYGTRKLNVRYYGLPSGQEFAPFIYAHQYIANGEIKLGKRVVEKVDAIDVPLHIKIFVTPECPYCPIVVDYFNQMAMVNDELLVETIEAVELPLEADLYHIESVPFVVINRMEDYSKYGAKPLSFIPGYVLPEQAAEILERAARKAKKQGGTG
ncbi:MAG: thioredoxin family protein [Desulfurococcaceae archaeon]